MHSLMLQLAMLISTRIPDSDTTRGQKIYRFFLVTVIRKPSFKKRKWHDFTSFNSARPGARHTACTDPIDSQDMLELYVCVCHGVSRDSVNVSLMAACFRRMDFKVGSTAKHRDRAQLARGLGDGSSITSQTRQVSRSQNACLPYY